MKLQVMIVVAGLISALSAMGEPVAEAPKTSQSGIEEVKTANSPIGDAKTGGPITQGQRIFFTGHSFHYFIPPILENIADSAGITGQQNLGLSAIGGSHVSTHWDVPDEKNQAKMALRTGKVDVLTLAPLYMPDDGIEKFATLALAYNPNIRITVQEIWLRWDTYEPTAKVIPPPSPCDHNAVTIAELRERHAPLFKSIDDHVAELNQKFGKQVLFIVPTGQAVIALRERVLAGKAGGLKTQSELFSDPIAHPTPPMQVLVAYCHYAVIYRRSPVGLPMPEILAKAQKPEWGAETLRVLQEVAWEAVTQHPQSGVRDAGAAGNAK